MEKDFHVICSIIGCAHSFVLLAVPQHCARQETVVLRVRAAVAVE